MPVRASLYSVKKKTNLMLLNGLLNLESAQHVSDTYMPIIRSSSLYWCYYRIWCVMSWLLVVGRQVQGSGLCVRDEGSCASRLPHPCCPAPDRRPPATKALHTICGNNTSIVSSSWWWAYKCPKHVEQIISAINQPFSSIQFVFRSTFVLTNELDIYTRHFISSCF